MSQPSPNAFHHRNYLLFWIGRLLSTMGMQIVSVAVGWQIYDITRDPLALGFVGLVQFLPSAVLVLVTGAVADLLPRRLIMAACMVVVAAAAAALAWMAGSASAALPLIYLAILTIGVGRAFYSPASSALVPSLVPPEALASAVTWVTSAWQAATIVGPVIGGFLYDVAADLPYIVALALFVGSGVLIYLVDAVQKGGPVREAGLGNVIAGFRYIWGEKIVLGAISLDLFAVLLGGATALLPAIARDVLQTGPLGLGFLRAAPAVGAILVAAWVSQFPIRDHAGRLMFACVAGFGAATVVFGVSQWLWVSVAAAAVMGATDMISVVVRETLIQLWTPEAVRGRVTAVNSVFVGASNEIGEFRAGTVAWLIGTVPAIVIGGIGTVIVALLWSRWFPALFNARRLDAPVR
ncbi:MAG: MFS transporter [Bauldia sp.]